jgi:hypothetical protein
VSAASPSSQDLNRLSEAVFAQASPTNPAIFTNKVRAAGAEARSVRFDKKPYTPRGVAECGSRLRNKLAVDGAERRFSRGADCLVLRGKVDDEGQLGLGRLLIQTRSSAVVFCILSFEIRIVVNELTAASVNALGAMRPQGGADE